MGKNPDGSITIRTVGDNIDHGHHISYHCKRHGCLFQGEIDLEGLADYVGRDFVCNARTLAPYFKCPTCGGTEVGFIVSTTSGAVGVNTPSSMPDLAAEMKKAPLDPEGPRGGKTY